MNEAFEHRPERSPHSYNIVKCCSYTKYSCVTNQTKDSFVNVV